MLKPRNDNGSAPLKLRFGVQATLFLLLACAVVMGVGWLLLRSLSGALAVRDQLDVFKITLSVVAGIGGVVALTVAYRKQRLGELAHQHAEAAERRAEQAERREDTKLFNERFAACVGQLGSDEPTVRLGGVYAIAGLADDWDDGRQRCIDVLCAYLRMPRAETAPTSSDEQSEHPAVRQPERQVRATIWRVIGNHLRPATPESPSWCGYDFDFTGAVIDGADFRRARFTGGNVIFDGADFIEGANFRGAKFSGGEVAFHAARFTGGTAQFDMTEFRGGSVAFIGTMFIGGTVLFDLAQFSGTDVRFQRAKFAGGEVSFRGAEFTDSVGFQESEFTGSNVTFFSARFPSGEVDFYKAQITDGEVCFPEAKFIGGLMSFREAQFAGGVMSFDEAEFTAGLVSFREAQFTGGVMTFHEAQFAGGRVDFSQASRHDVPPVFDTLDPPPPGLQLPE